MIRPFHQWLRSLCAAIESMQKVLPFREQSRTLSTGWQRTNGVAAMPGLEDGLQNRT
ncbi:hypothetical protein [Azospirillum palustre]